MKYNDSTFLNKIKENRQNDPDPTKKSTIWTSINQKYSTDKILIPV